MFKLGHEFPDLVIKMKQIVDWKKLNAKIQTLQTEHLDQILEKNSVEESEAEFTVKL